MKIIKKILFVLIGTVAILLIVAIFLPSTVIIERSLSINAPANVIYKQVNKLKNWDQWSPFFKMDPEADFLHEGPEFGVGAVRIWDGEHVGKGKMTIIESTPYISIISLLEFEGQGDTGSWFTFNDSDDHTIVSWGIQVDDLPYPIGRFGGLLMKISMSGTFDSGLQDLAILCEAMPTLPKIVIDEFDGLYSLGIRDSCYFMDIAEKMSDSFVEISSYMDKKRIVMQGAPFVVYYSWDSDKPFVMDLCIPVEKGLKGQGRIYPVILEKGKVILAYHYGSYDKTGETHAAIMEYIAEHKLEVRGNPWESYVTDPGSEPDQSKWLTMVYWPI